ncbi:Carboxylesterase YbfK [Microbacterium oxydans]|uniref:Carboxylesterase YbfK n=1 Tax=Microbacterium oxydans TaxID=82380 RepID=A0A0F0KT85_9MICO|nr:alpha/beta fold hydrolase [Microbacterium oxydans]KJL22441.1 Carboxylesterase YbfK [Microbacterium oxydans]
MTDNRRFRTAVGENEVRHSYEALIAKHIPDVVRRTVPTSIGPVATLTTGPESGTPVVLLHGSGATALSWAPVLLRLSDQYRLHAIDLPGEAGASTPTRVPFVAEEQARWLAEVHRELVDRPAVFVGVSVGGWIATALAVHEPQRVSRLVLQSASGFGPRKTFPLVLAGVLSMLGDRGRRQALAYLTGPRADAGHRSMMQRDIDAFALRTFAHFVPRTDALPEHDGADLARIRAQITAAYGAEDRMLDASAAARKLRTTFPTATVDLRERVGHLIDDQATLTRQQLSAIIP